VISAALGQPGRAVFSPPLERALCVLVVAGAVKMPLGIPLYFNATLLLLGLFSLVVLQAVAAWQQGIVADAGPRLGQLFLMLLATALIQRLDPEMLGRHFALLLPLFLLVMVVEPLLPEPLYKSRSVFGISVVRQAGLQGEPNYNAMLYGVVGVILAQHRPAWLGIPPFLLALPSLSRGLIAAIVAWCGARLSGRQAVWLVPLAVLLLCTQPLVVLTVDGSIDDATRATLNELSSNRYLIWVAHAQAGASTPLGVGYFNGQAAITAFAGLPPTSAGEQAHSIFLQVFGEFGWFGYLAFVGFLLQTSLIVARRAPAQLPLLLFILTGYALLNGLTDWPFWVGIGYVLAHTGGRPR
jgi:hypothetical protein